MDASNSDTSCQNYANQAQSYALDASNSDISCQNYVIQAQSYALDASNNSIYAYTYATDAFNYRKDAKGYMEATETARTEAYGSAAAASGSATSAGTSALSTAKDVLATGVSATAAGVSATAAATSATAAEGSATDAAGSATDAAQSASDAQQAVDDINYDRITTLEHKTTNISIPEGQPDTFFSNNIHIGTLLNEKLTFNSDGSIYQVRGANTLRETTVDKLTSSGDINQTGSAATAKFQITEVASLTVDANISQTFGTAVLKSLTSDSLNTGHITQLRDANSSLSNVLTDQLYTESILPPASCSFNTGILPSKRITIGSADGEVVLNGSVIITNSVSNTATGFFNQTKW